MRKWELVCSVDADGVDYSEVIESDTEPGFWDCYEIAEQHGCPWFTLDELEDD